MEVVGQLTGGIAHDFNNLLTILLGNAEILSEELADNPQLYTIAQALEATALRGADLTQRLLAFSRRQALEPKVIDVNRLVTRTGELLHRTLGERSEEHTSELQSLMRISYAVFCLKKKKTTNNI